MELRGEIMIWNRIRNYWPFVKGIRLSPCLAFGIRSSWCWYSHQKASSVELLCVLLLPLLLSLLSLPRASCWANNRYACDIWDANTHVTSLMISVSFNCISRMINLCDKLRYWLSRGATQFTLKSIFDLLRRYPYSIDPDLFRKLRELFSQDLVKSRNNDT